MQKPIWFEINKKEFEELTIDIYNNQDNNDFKIIINKRTWTDLKNSKKFCMKLTNNKKLMKVMKLVALENVIFWIFSKILAQYLPALLCTTKMCLKKQCLKEVFYWLQSPSNMYKKLSNIKGAVNEVWVDSIKEVLSKLQRIIGYTQRIIGYICI